MAAGFAKVISVLNHFMLGKAPPSLLNYHELVYVGQAQTEPDENQE